jgi:mono/diheme cytochrome c family protein
LIQAATGNMPVAAWNCPAGSPSKEAHRDARILKIEKMPVTLRKFLLAATLSSIGAYAVAEQRTVNDGVYTEDQADAGEVLYTQHCLLCHDKKYFRPVLQRWEGQPLGIMFTVMSTSMPESNPGFLSEKEYVDILAYILSLSRYEAGDIELDYQDGALNSLLVEARKR